MKKIIIILFAAVFSSQVFAMSHSPEPYTPPTWHENANAEDDAAFAVAHKDFRLLAYAARNTVVPGVDQNEKAMLSKICGLRMIEGFGDVVRSQAQLQAMKTMHDYAMRYNKIISTQCRAANSSEK